MLLAGAVPAAAAMDSDDAYVDSVCRQFDLNEVVVTGTRTPKFLKDTPIQTRVSMPKNLPDWMLPMCRTCCNRNCRAWNSRMR